MWVPYGVAFRYLMYGFIGKEIIYKSLPGKEETTSEKNRSSIQTQEKVEKMVRSGMPRPKKHHKKTS